jgi:hypothetical protein
LWLQTAYAGRVYYWLEEARVLPMHFRDYYRSVRGRTRDYQKLSRMKVPLNGQAVSIVDDFQPLNTKARISKFWSIPAAKLMIDAQPRWY